MDQYEGKGEEGQIQDGYHNLKKNSKIKLMLQVDIWKRKKFRQKIFLKNWSGDIEGHIIGRKNLKNQNALCMEHKIKTQRPMG